MKLFQQGYKKIIQPIVFLFPAEAAHKLSLNILKLLYRLKLLSLCKKDSKNLSFQTSYLTFPNKVGIAPGLDKDGDFIASLAALGVGFIELGTVTPLPQYGNTKPRLFRLKAEEAVINRMGFNNKGIDNLIKNIQQYKKLLKATDDQPILGINIGKNALTPIEAAIDDYLICFKKAYLLADYITINISSPNTKNLRDLQNKDYLDELLKCIKNEQIKLSEIHDKYTPIALKIAPDLDDDDIDSICLLCLKYTIDIIIATNTTNEDKLLYDNKGQKIMGGLSGRPLLIKSNSVLHKITSFLRKNNVKNHSVTVIGVGGINSVLDAQSKFNFGADMIQLYTGLVYNGPLLITKILESLKDES